MRSLTFKQQAVTNLTFDQQVVKDFSGLDSLPGFVVVVFERREMGGAVFSRLVNSGERFRSRFSISRRDLSEKYFAIAVNDSVLNHTFERSITLDDGSEVFTLTFQLSFRVADARKVAETREHDPLLKLRDEIARVITRNCAKRKAEMFRDRFRDLERIVIDSESARLRTYASDLGFKIISIDLDKPSLPDIHRKVLPQEKERPWEKRSHEIQQDIDSTKERLPRERERQRDKEKVDHKYDLQRLELQRQIELNGELDEVHRAQQKRPLLKIETDAIGQAFANVGASINTPAELRDAFEVTCEIGDNTQTNYPALSSSTEERPIERQRAGGEIQTESSSGKQQSAAEPGPDEPASQSLPRETWKSEAAVLIKLLDNAGADSATTARLRDELGAIEARFFSPTDTSDAVVSTLRGDEPALDSVTCSVFAPHQATRGSKIMVQVFAHLAIDSETAKTLAVEFDQLTKRLAAKPLDHEVEPGSELTFCLFLPGLEIDEPVQRLTWRGQPNAIQFGVYVPKEIDELDIVGTVYVSQSGIPFGHSKFLLRVVDFPDSVEQKNTAKESAWTRYKYAFISYASPDRPEVLKRVQMLSRFHIDFFQDLLTLEPGEQWEQVIYESIDKSDVFFLFWSNAARNSEWVMKEIEYALERKGPDRLAAPEIVPVIIEGPPPVPPPAELKDIHFNDQLIYFINAR